MTGPLATLPVIAELKTSLSRLRPGEAHFAHLLLPHHPYNLNADCSVRPEIQTWLKNARRETAGKLEQQNTAASREQRYRRYFVQLECTQAIIGELLEAIKSSGQWERTIIIIHGDHGSRIVRHVPHVSTLESLAEDDFRDAYSTFFALKNESSAGRVNTSLLPLQAILANVWQLPAAGLERQQVYVASATDLLPIPLIGFDQNVHATDSAEID